MAKQKTGVFAAPVTSDGKNIPLNHSGIWQLEKGMIYNPAPNRKQRRSEARKPRAMNNRKWTLGRHKFRMFWNGYAIPNAIPQHLKN